MYYEFTLSKQTFLNIISIKKERDVAQFGSAPALGAGCRRFKSCHPDFIDITHHQLE